MIQFEAPVFYLVRQDIEVPTVEALGTPYIAATEISDWYTYVLEGRPSVQIQRAQGKLEVVLMAGELQANLLNFDVLGLLPQRLS